MCLFQYKAAIPKSWFLLDRQPTVDVLADPRLLTNAKQTLTLHSNAGKDILTQKGNLK